MSWLGIIWVASFSDYNIRELFRYAFNTVIWYKSLCCLAFWNKSQKRLQLPGQNGADAQNQSINRTTNQSISRSINQSINQSNNQSINQSINQSMNQSINRTTNQSINQSINLEQPREKNDSLQRKISLFSSWLFQYPLSKYYPRLMTMFYRNYFEDFQGVGMARTHTLMNAL